MKEAHLRNVEARLGRSGWLLDDPERTKKMLRRVEADAGLRRGDVNRRVEDVERLLGRDVPELIGEIRRLNRERVEMGRALRASLDT